MVRYVFNSWRGRDEMLLVRRQFYDTAPASAAPAKAAKAAEGAEGAEGGDEKRRRRRQQQQRAVARVSMWMARQHCSHMVESTALLTAAMLSDDDATENNGWSTYAVRATYAAAFSRFVTGLLDGLQDKQRKQSMYAVAKKIGLPATFVELRHQSTHEQLPSLAKLRSMAGRALAWIWDYFWKNLADDDSPRGHRQPDLCREAILEFLRGGDDDPGRRPRTMKELKKWPVDRVLRTVADLPDTLPGNQVYLKCLKLSREVMAARADEAEAGGPAGGEAAAGNADAPVEEQEPEEGSERAAGWFLCEGPWKPKPIGVV
ncbi:Pre-rRNA-processing protein las1 [Tolypocladium capitatum]|uniref:Pre-rRNA-processing protein las1 n=1 Tax=Tolypocladium capitatum TaxID=45235 RepID=A0A2K3QBB4_9HYPO|nr:Pre-rRNA-processing protein las1 [Tolypocladium capitatum]